MKAPTLLLIALFAVSPAMIAQQDATFTKWMTLCHQSWSALNKMETKTGRPAIRQAENLGVLYEDMVAFWRQRNAAATQISIEGKAAAGILAAAAYSNDAAKANEAFTALSGTCKSCHEARRTKLPNGKFGFKSFTDPK